MKQNLKIDEKTSSEVFSVLVEKSRGPIRMLAFKAISHNIKLLIKSLEYIEYNMQSLGPISFSYEALLETLDFNNTQICKALTRLILNGVPYEHKWVELLIKITNKTQSHREIINYFISENWISNQNILQFLSTLSD